MKNTEMLGRYGEVIEDMGINIEDYSDAFYELIDECDCSEKISARIADKLNGKTFTLSDENGTRSTAVALHIAEEIFTAYGYNDGIYALDCMIDMEHGTISGDGYSVQW